MAVEQQTDDMICEHCDEAITGGDDFVRAVFGSMTEGAGALVDETERYYHWPSCAKEVAASHEEDN